MNDNEIFLNEIACIKRRASGKCNGGTDCNTCDLLMNENEIIKAYKNAIKNNNIINELKIEIDRLRNIIINFMNEVENWEHEYNIDTTNIPKIAILGAEKNDILKQIIIKAQKDFGNKLKKYSESFQLQPFGPYYNMIDVQDIDNLLKEINNN